MKKKVFLVIIVLILTIINFILFKNFYEEKVNDNKLIENTNFKS